ncbi:MAG TPA: hypothetical protein VFQ92_15925, partial [Blastocatellia bacterium]|nr:hypothetical protein [Blastocatellia bacterium]
MRDLIGTSGVVISLLGLFFLVYGIIDYLFQLSRPVRLGIAFIAAVSAFAAIARTIHTARRRDILWAASEVEKETGAFNNELVAFAESYDHPSSIAPYIRERLEAALSVRLSALRSNQVVSIRPSRPALILFMQVAVTYVLLAALLPGPVKETF